MAGGWQTSCNCTSSWQQFFASLRELDQVKGTSAPQIVLTFSPNSHRTALHWAVEGGHLEIVRLLIQYGAYAHVVDEYGWNLLHRACIKGHLQVRKF